MDDLSLFEFDMHAATAIQAVARSHRSFKNNPVTTSGCGTGNGQAVIFDNHQSFDIHHFFDIIDYTGTQFLQFFGNLGPAKGGWAISPTLWQGEQTVGDSDRLRSFRALLGHLRTEG